MFTAILITCLNIFGVTINVFHLLLKREHAESYTNNTQLTSSMFPLISSILPAKNKNKAPWKRLMIINVYTWFMVIYRIKFTQKLHD
jgi:hypothetical protein